MRKFRAAFQERYNVAGRDVIFVGFFVADGIGGETDVEDFEVADIFAVFRVHKSGFWHLECQRKCRTNNVTATGDAVGGQAAGEVHADDTPNFL